MREPARRRASMGLLTIGAYARASRLSPKALRLYDDLGLLTPARVDPVTGYRWYDPAQLERARLVAWLRRLGMPLARISEVCDLDPSAAANEVRTCPSPGLVLPNSSPPTAASFRGLHVCAATPDVKEAA